MRVVLKVCHPVQGCESLICMPVTTPQIKVDAVRRLGGTVQLVGESYTETQSHAWVRATAAHVFCKIRCCTAAHDKLKCCGRKSKRCTMVLLMCLDRQSIIGHIMQRAAREVGLLRVCSQERARTEGRVFIAPYDDPYTIAGQATVGMEILSQV